MHLSANRRRFFCICLPTGGYSFTFVYRQTAICLHPCRKTDILLHRGLPSGRRLFFCTVYRKKAIRLQLSTDRKILACLWLTVTVRIHLHLSTDRWIFVFLLLKIDNLVCICLQTDSRLFFWISLRTDSYSSKSVYCRRLFSCTWRKLICICLQADSYLSAYV